MFLLCVSLYSQCTKLSRTATNKSQLVEYSSQVQAQPEPMVLFFGNPTLVKHAHVHTDRVLAQASAPDPLTRSGELERSLVQGILAFIPAYPFFFVQGWQSTVHQMAS